MTHWVPAPKDVVEEVEELARERGLAPGQVLGMLAAEMVRSRRAERYLPPPLRQAGDIDLTPIADTISPIAFRIAAEISHGQGPKSTDLAETIGIHPGNINRHLTKLRAAGYVETRNARHYLVQPEEAAA